MSTRGIETAVLAAAASALLALSAGAALAFPKPKYPVDLPPQSQAEPAAPKPAVPAVQTPAPAPAPPAPPRAVPIPPRGAPDTLVYTVARGDTLTGVGRRFTVGVARIASLNGLDPAAGLPAGTKLRLPPGAHDGGKDPYAQGPVSGGSVSTIESASAAASKPPVRTAQTGPAPVAMIPARPPASGLRPPLPAPGATIQPAPQPTAQPIVGYPTPTDVAALGRGRFVWPVKGDILSPYNPLRTDLGNDGLNIGAEAGTGVHAAAAGFVVYAGDYPGFGNLVLVKHSDGWVTAYGHLESIEVRMRDHVDQGQEIGRVGQTGGVTSPQLHFEIRYAPTPKEKARPVDPDLLLPR